ncbi:MAG: alpha/beta hydrolase [Candidatus Eisenbacteria bacterium]|nr:alpha/beta hydrolase [Candidatus Eisenbacteria bacterium]
MSAFASLRARRPAAFFTLGTVLALLAGLAWPHAAARAADGLAGRWEGGLQGPGVNLALSAEFTAKDGGLAGTLDIPAQGATGLVLVDIVSGADGKVSFSVQTGGAPGAFVGAFSGDSLSGDYTQGPFKGTFSLHRAAAKPVVPAEPVPYREEEVSFANGEVKLAGTLTVPPGKGPFPAVILVTGSGPQNRDEEIFSFKPFRLIADHLSRHGVAVLRYDDRGIAKSTGDFAASTTADFAGDAHAAVEYLRSPDFHRAHPEVNAKRVGICGHSEGGLIGPMVANRNPGVAFVVLMAGPGVTGEKILLEQGQEISRAGRATPEELAQQAALQRRIFKAVRGVIPWDTVRASMMEMGRRQIAALPEAQRQAVGDPEKYLAGVVDQQLQGSKSPWMRYFLDHDPAPELQKLRVPVLALFGEKDLQVPTAQNRPAVEGALRKGGNKAFRAHVFPKANHLFLTSETGSPAEYPSMKKEFVPGFLDTLSAWISRTPPRKK